jgi:hypothetical protein
MSDAQARTDSLSTIWPENSMQESFYSRTGRTQGYFQVLNQSTPVPYSTGWTRTWDWVNSWFSRLQTTKQHVPSSDGSNHQPHRSFDPGLQVKLQF